MENNHRLEKDVILICKGRYNNKYKSELEAFRAYYHKHYSGMEDFEPNRAFIVNLFLKPTIQYILETRNNIIYSFINGGLFDYSYREKIYFEDGYYEFYDVLYYRLISWICSLSLKEKKYNGWGYDWEYIDIDFSEYPLYDENWEGVI